MDSCCFLTRALRGETPRGLELATWSGGDAVITVAAAPAAVVVNVVPSVMKEV